jgi:hypothetical protein
MAFLSWGIFMAVWTIDKVSGTPISEDRSFMGKYQDVDENINEIMTNNLKFLSRYKIVVENKIITIGKHQLKIKILDNSGALNKSANIIARISRHERSDKDIVLKQFSVSDIDYTSKEFEVDLKGRWLIDIKVTIDGLNGHIKYYVYKDGQVSIKKDFQQRD